MMKQLNRPWVAAASRASPHRSSRLGAKVDAIFLHYTAGGSHIGTVQWFLDPVSKASAHFVVGRDGSIVQCVGLDHRAWHAGRGRFQTAGIERVEAVDRSAIGIEMANYGLLVKGEEGGFWFERGRNMQRFDEIKYGHPVYAKLDFIDPHAPDVDGYWEPYPEPQIRAVVKLCRALREEFEIPLHRIVGHEDVAFPLGRKTDPGPLFPWQSFMEQVALNTEGETGGILPANTFFFHKTRVRGAP